MQPIRVTVEQVKQVSEELDADAVIVIAFRGDSYATTSYGKDSDTCAVFGKVCDQIHDDIEHGIIEIPQR